MPPKNKKLTKRKKVQTAPQKKKKKPANWSDMSESESEEGETTADLLIAAAELHDAA
jgi:hypothetical protein